MSEFHGAGIQGIHAQVHCASLMQGEGSATFHRFPTWAAAFSSLLTVAPILRSSFSTRGGGAEEVRGKYEKKCEKSSTNCSLDAKC